MSFSFSLRATNVEAAREAVAARLEQVVKEQPAHAADLDECRDVANAYLSLLTPKDDKDIVISMSGSIATGAAGVEWVNVSFGAGFTSRE